MQQLSKFMGHTLKTHCTAKVSKLLLLMMEGGAEKFKDKQLEEIDIQLTPVNISKGRKLLNNLMSKSWMKCTPNHLEEENGHLSKRLFLIFIRAS
ncbi:hypothetical protein JTB14_037799 [Gonioctena quinquepunctata]|nr:hypothetical protein JTB14_037799 [Gonioctena quinquepunctata]